MCTSKGDKRQKPGYFTPGPDYFASGFVKFCQITLRLDFLRQNRAERARDGDGENEQANIDGQDGDGVDLKTL